MNDPEQFVSYVAPVLLVGNLGRSLAFYERQLGFRTEFNYESSYASVWRSGCRLHLKQSLPPTRDQLAFEAAENIDVYFDSPAVEALASELTTSGVTFFVPLRTMPYGKEFYVRDPDGYVLAFVQAT